MAHAVFISYAAGDAKVADAVCSTLESRGISCWMAPRDILPGKHFAEAIIDAINETRIIVLVFSSSANKSTQVLREVERAASKDIPIVTFRVEDIPPTKSLEYFISSHHWLDAAGRSLEGSLERLANTIERLLSPRKDRPYAETARGAILTAAPAQAEKKTHPVWFWFGLLLVMAGLGWFTALAVVAIADDAQELNGGVVFITTVPFAVIGAILVMFSGRRLRHVWFWPGVVMFAYGLASAPAWLVIYHYSGFPYDWFDLRMAVLGYSIPFVIAGAILIWLGWPRTGVRHPRGEVLGFISIMALFCLGMFLAGVNGGNGTERDIISFNDDFDDGIADGWHLDGGWGIALDGDNYILSGSGTACPWVTWAQDYVLELDFELVSGSFWIWVRDSKSGRFYVVNIERTGFSLGRHSGQDFFELRKDEFDIGYGRWHKVGIAVQGGSINFYIDNEVKIDYKDMNPLPAGAFMIGSHSQSIVRLDNISVRPSS